MSQPEQQQGVDQKATVQAAIERAQATLNTSFENHPDRGVYLQNLNRVAAPMFQLAAQVDAGEEHPSRHIRLLAKVDALIQCAELPRDLDEAVREAFAEGESGPIGGVTLAMLAQLAKWKQWVVKYIPAEEQTELDDRLNHIIEGVRNLVFDTAVTKRPIPREFELLFDLNTLIGQTQLPPEVSTQLTLDLTENILPGMPRAVALAMEEPLMMPPVKLTRQQAKELEKAADALFKPAIDPLHRKAPEFSDEQIASVEKRGLPRFLQPEPMPELWDEPPVGRVGILNKSQTSEDAESDQGVAGVFQFTAADEDAEADFFEEDPYEANSEGGVHEVDDREDDDQEESDVFAGPDQEPESSLADQTAEPAEGDASPEPAEEEEGAVAAEGGDDVEADFFNKEPGEDPYAGKSDGGVNELDVEHADEEDEEDEDDQEEGEEAADPEGEPVVDSEPAEAVEGAEDAKPAEVTVVDAETAPTLEDKALVVEGRTLKEELSEQFPPEKTTVEKEPAVAPADYVPDGQMPSPTPPPVPKLLLRTTPWSDSEFNRIKAAFEAENFQPNPQADSAGNNLTYRSLVLALSDQRYKCGNKQVVDWQFLLNVHTKDIEKNKLDPLAFYHFANSLREEGLDHQALGNYEFARDMSEAKPTLAIFHADCKARMEEIQANPTANKPL